MDRRGFLKGLTGAIAAAGAAIVVPPMVVENEILQPHLEIFEREGVLKVYPDPLDILNPEGFEIVMRFRGGAEFRGKFVTSSLSFTQSFTPPIDLPANEWIEAIPQPDLLDLSLVTVPGIRPTWSTWEERHDNPN